MLSMQLGMLHYDALDGVRGDNQTTASDFETTPIAALPLATRRCRPAYNVRLELSSSAKCLQGGRGPLGAKAAGQCRTFARLRYLPG